MSDLITFEVARARIKAAAEERPDHTTGKPFAERALEDVGCRYLEDDGTPSCLVGTALADILVEAGLTPGHDSNDESIAGLIDAGLIKVTARAAHFMEVAQASQDTGSTWAVAFAQAEAGDDPEYDDTEPADVDDL